MFEQQENRIGKAVEVMIQHVENLRRTYTKEHSELLELREALMQSERSFGSQTEKGLKPFHSHFSSCVKLFLIFNVLQMTDDFRGKKQPSKYTVGYLRTH